MRHTPGVTGVLELELVWLMCVAHISGRYCFSAGSSRGRAEIRATPSVSVQLVGGAGALTVDMQRSRTTHPTCLHSSTFCACLLSLLMSRWLTFLPAENFVMEVKQLPIPVSAEACFRDAERLCLFGTQTQTALCGWYWKLGLWSTLFFFHVSEKNTKWTHSQSFWTSAALLDQ